MRHRDSDLSKGGVKLTTPFLFPPGGAETQLRDMVV